MRRALSVLLGVFAIALVAASDTVRSAEAPTLVTPTFTKDVAPIVYNHCAQCHRPGEVAPMSLLSYQDARPWAKAIKAKVTTRQMPPWGANPALSLPMRNDVSLSDKEIQTIAAWVDAGAPRGNDADMPATPQFATGWTY